MREDYNILTRLIYLAMAGLWRERNELMELEELFRLRQARRYSIHIMASLMGMSVDYYLELEFSVREADAAEIKLLEEILASRN